MKQQESPFDSEAVLDTTAVAIIEDTVIDLTIDPTIIMAHATEVTIPHIIMIPTIAIIEEVRASISILDSLNASLSWSWSNIWSGSFFVLKCLRINHFYLNNTLTS
jgi:hypothetical protein